MPSLRRRAVFCAAALVALAAAQDPAAGGDAPCSFWDLLAGKCKGDVPPPESSYMYHLDIVKTSECKHDAREPDPCQGMQTFVDVCKDDKGHEVDPEKCGVKSGRMIAKRCQIPPEQCASAPKHKASAPKAKPNHHKAFWAVTGTLITLFGAVILFVGAVHALRKYREYKGQGPADDGYITLQLGSF